MFTSRTPLTYEAMTAKVCRHTRLLTLIVAFIAAAPFTSSAQEGTLTDDAYYPQPTKGYNVKVLTVDGGTATAAYVRFRLNTSLPPDTPGSHIGKATLKLYVGSVTTAGSFNLHRVTASWKETNTTAPTYDPSPLTPTPVAVANAETFVTLDLTSLVQQWLGTDGHGAGGLLNYGVAIVPVGSTNFSFDSKEATQTSHVAQVEMVLNHAATADHATTADSATAVTGTVSAGQVSGALTIATIDGSKVTGAVANASNANTASSVSVPLSLSGTTAGAILSAHNSQGNGLGGSSSGGNGVHGNSGCPNCGGVRGDNLSGNGVIGNSESGNGLYGVSNSGTGVLADSRGGAAVLGRALGANAVGVVGSNPHGGLAARFDGNVTINGSLSLPVASNFSAGSFTASQYNIGSNRVLSAPGDNFFAGPFAGQNNTEGVSNSFVGHAAGYSNTTGHSNSFFGLRSGEGTSTGVGNSFFGAFAGRSNATGHSNSFFGLYAGESNTGGVANSFFGAAAGRSNAGHQNSFFGYSAGSNNTGGNNSFFGTSAGQRNTTGHSNSFFGMVAGQNNTDGTRNSFFGVNAGASNTTEHGNTFIGADANGAAGITNATAVGAGAVVTQSNSVVLGNNAGVGIGTSAPQAMLHAVGESAGKFDGNVSINGNLNVTGTTTATVTNANHATTAATFSGILAGEVTGTQSATVVSAVGGQTADSVVRAMTAANAATSANNANAIVKRDGSGNFSAGIVSANIVDAPEYTIGGMTLLRTYNASLFLGRGTGQEGDINTFVGTNAGHGNINGDENAFFGAAAGYKNTTGHNNSFIGIRAGVNNITGFGNSFFGGDSGRNNTYGIRNTFVGVGAGESNTNEDDNTFIGALSNGAVGVKNATAIGFGAVVTQSNSVVLGNNASVGIGTSAPKAKLHVEGGDVYVPSIGTGIILKATDGGNCFRVTVNNNGLLNTTLVGCP